MLTKSARRAMSVLDGSGETVVDLAAIGPADRCRDIARANVAARRWQRIGRAFVLHTGTPTPHELRRAALINMGPRAVLTAFTALEEWGLVGWEREVIHVLVPRGARVRRPAELQLRVHYTDLWEASPRHVGRALHRPAAAAVRAAATFAGIRPACAILAAVVQQRLVRPGEVLDSVAGSPRIRHRAALLAAAHDIAQGAHALSEIDFIRLCRAAGLSQPAQQKVRIERSGRRRYLDAVWDLPDGRRLVVEVDGALHLVPGRWWEDQLRQNELAISGDVVLRFPSVVVRNEPVVVTDQLRSILGRLR
jgi:hypothetical protein